MFLSQISPRIKKDSQRASSVRLSTSSKKGRWASTVRAHQELLQNSILRSSAVASPSPAQAGRHTQHRAAGREEGFWERKQGGGYGTHHIEAVIIGGKARRRIHARVLLLQNGRQRARRRDTKAGWLQCRAGEILHWISDWGNE